MESQGPRNERVSDELWQARQRYWRRKLGRLRLGVEPLDEQLVRYRRVTWMLTAVPLVIGLMFLGLFAAFERPDVGLVVAAVLLVPIVAIAWIDYGMLRWRVARYLDEESRLSTGQTTTGRT
jgi:membrane protein YdbS with pleckstrin-like domain